MTSNARPGIVVAVYTDVRKTDSQETRNALASVLDSIADELREGRTPTCGSEVLIRAGGGVVTENIWELRFGTQFQEEE